ncbi:MAG TPA: threonine ammonia-lyase [Gammaproteobacteria bacterium]
MKSTRSEQGMRESSHLPITIADVRAAAERIAGRLPRTPAAVSETLSEIAGCRVYLKFEIFQFTASFKERGALSKLLTLTDAERRSGVLTVSAGNHAQAVAHHCRRLVIPATVVMPRFTPFSKVARTKACGADVVLAGETFAEAVTAAVRIGGERGLTLVHPFDDPAVMAGQGTLALEFLEDCPDLDVLVAPIGGGGLIAGCAVAAKAVKPDIEIVGVQAAAYPGMKALFEHVEVRAGRQTIADGIAVKTPGELTRRVVAACVDEILLVKEDEIEQAVCLLAEIEKVVVEGAGATTLAAVLAHAGRFAGKRVGLVLSGANIDSRTLAGCLLRGLVRDGRMIRLAIEMEDVPGSLARVASIIGEAGGNIIEVLHQRLSADLSLRYTTLEIQIETRDRLHSEAIVAALSSAGFSVTVRR